MSIRERVREFILTNYLFTDEQSKLSDTQSLMQSGTMDSTGILELILFIEESFGVKVADTDMVPQNFDSVRNVVAYVERKLA